jgi:hypothetical protein
MSFGTLICLVGYAIFHRIKVSQMMNWSTPLWRAHRDDWNWYITCYIWSLEKIYQSATTLILEGSRGHEKRPDRSRPWLVDRWGRPAPPLCRLALGCVTSPRAFGMFLLRLLGSHLRPIEVGLSNGGRGRSHGSMTWQLLGLYSTSAYIRMPLPGGHFSFKLSHNTRELGLDSLM